MRFVIGHRGQVHFPIDFLREPSRPQNRTQPPVPLPPTTIVGPTAASIEAAASSGWMNDLLVTDGDPPYKFHDRVGTLIYTFDPTPTLTFSTGPESSDYEFRFVNAVVLDWATDPTYSAADPNDELCDFLWDGQQHFLLQFLSNQSIVRAELLEITKITR